MSKYCFINGNVLSGQADMKPQKLTVLVENDTIISLIPAENYSEEIAEKDGYEIIDLNGKYLMPGLINLHVHLPAGGTPKKKPRDNAKTVRLVMSTALTRSIIAKVCEKNARTQLLSGVTTIRTVGGVSNFDTRLRDAVNSGKVLGPRILASNMAISVPGGHMAGSLAYEAQSADHARELVDIIAKDHPDLIKLMITGGVLDAKVKGEPGILKMPADYVKAACDEAHKLGFKVAAHVESPEGVRVAVEGGVDSIEHGSVPSDETLKLMKKRGAVQVLTISPALPFFKLPFEVNYANEMSSYNSEVLATQMLDCAKICLKNNIPVGLGTDTGCPFVEHDGTWREILLFQKYLETDPAFALHTATLLNAKIVGLDKVTGSVEEGKCADLLITEKNPLDDFHNLRDPFMVMARGKLIRNPKVKHKKVIETALDSYM